MTNQEIINKINAMELHNDDQVDAYTKDEFDDLDKEIQLTADELDFEKENLDKNSIILHLFNGEGADEQYFNLSDINYSDLQDYLCINNKKTRLQLLRLSKDFKENN